MKREPRKTVQRDGYDIPRFMEDNGLIKSYFGFLKECYDTNIVSEKKFATKELTKIVAKMVPQTLDGVGDDGSILISWKDNEEDSN
jgi:hypothetical protein